MESGTSSPTHPISSDSPEVDWFLRGKLPENTYVSPSDSPPPPTSSSIMEHLDHTDTAFHNGIIPDRPASTNCDIGHVLSRSVSLPDPEPKKKGFLRGLFGRKKGNSSASNTPSPSPSPLPRPTTLTSNTKTSSNFDNSHLVRTRSLSMSASTQMDPKLEEFFKYYKNKGIEKVQEDLNESCNSSITSSIVKSAAVEALKSTKIDVLGRPIPPHPKEAPLPSALVKNSHFERCVKDQLNHTNSQIQQQQQQQSGSLSNKLNFLRGRNQSVSSELPSRPLSISSSIVSKEAAKRHPLVIPGLENLPKLKRVAFDLPVFYNDPPQQIPSRNPRKGEVEIMPDGTIVIHKLTLAEKKKLMASTQGGIVVGGSGPLKILTKAEREDLDAQELKDGEKASPPSDCSSIMNETGLSRERTEEIMNAKEKTEFDHSSQAAESANAAFIRGTEAPNELKRISTNNEDEVRVNAEATKINIDKPMARHNKSFASLTEASMDNMEEKVNKGDVSIPHDVLYTRCCHLREILPIPATLKQLKKDSTDPIPLLQLRNPKPSLVEVLTFSDFVSVAPILCVSLDGVALSSEMFRIILSSLAHKNEFEKLTLRNTPIDEMGWRLLCWFLTKNKTLSRIDLTQVPSLSTNVQKSSKSSTTNNIIRMECDMNSRTDMNWNLFNAALISRKGIDELVLNGAKIEISQFKNLVEMGISLNTTKLGLAYNELTAEHIITLAENIDMDKIVGLDLAYNDLHGKLKFFSTAANEGFSGTNLRYLSLNSTNISNEHYELSDFITSFTKLNELRYLDLSNNKKLFPDLINTLSSILPLFPKLTRLHLDYNDLSQSFIVGFAELIPFCHSLSCISLVGNPLDNVSGTALANAMKKSHSVITLDLDFECLSADIKQEITIYTVRNMQNQVYNKDVDESHQSSEEWRSLQEELSHLLLRDKARPEPELVKNFVKRATDIRKKIHETIDELFNLRIQGKLNVDGKETLIRFCFIDSSIENGLKLLKQKSPDVNLDVGSFDNNPSESSLKSRGSTTNLIGSSYVTERGHDELLPFSMAVRDVGHEQENPEEIKDDGNWGRTADDTKLKEEASVLKIGSFLNQSNLRRTLSKEHLKTLKDMSGENYKEILLKTNNLNNVIDALDDMKAKGIPISEIYKKKAELDPGSIASNDILDLETLKNTSSNIGGKKVFDFHGPGRAENDLSGYSSEDSSNDSSGSDISPPSISHESIVNKDRDGLGQAFDEILDEIVRVRTNS